MLLFRLFVRWAYRSSSDRSFVDDPLTIGAIMLLGGTFVTLLMLPLLRRSRTETFSTILRASARGLAATLLVLQTLFILLSSFLAWQVMRGPHHHDYHDGATLPGMFLLSLVDIETYGLFVMFVSIPFALGQGAVGGALVVWLRNRFRLGQALPEEIRQN
ncbi:MAG: hypothetical protein DMG25_16805 [Acidobacteria bacterium]|nr:MAG: hypothetical protein DMG25_16805 [Acidobacteriota bacterium]